MNKPKPSENLLHLFFLFLFLFFFMNIQVSRIERFQHFGFFFYILSYVYKVMTKYEGEM